MNTASGSKRAGIGAFKYELLLLLVSIIWGSTFVAQQIGMKKGLGPMTFNALRFALGSLSLIPVIFWRKKNLSTPDAETKFPYAGSICAGVFLFGAAAFQQIGLQYTSAANSGFITSFYILFVPLLGMFFGRRIRKSLWVAILICLVGFYLLSVTGNFQVSKGDFLTLICAVIWAGHILVIDHIADKGDSIQIACVQFAVCALLSALCSFLFEHCSLTQVKAASMAVAYAGFVSVGIAYTLQVVCQKHCPPASAAIIMSLESVFAALFGYLVLNQTLTPRAILGCFLILLGVLIAQLTPLIRNKEFSNKV